MDRQRTRQGVQRRDGRQSRVPVHTTGLLCIDFGTRSTHSLVPIRNGEFNANPRLPTGNRVAERDCPAGGYVPMAHRSHRPLLMLPPVCAEFKKRPSRKHRRVNHTTGVAAVALQPGRRSRQRQEWDRPAVATGTTGLTLNPKPLRGEAAPDCCTIAATQSSWGTRENLHRHLASRGLPPATPAARRHGGWHSRICPAGGHLREPLIGLIQTSEEQSQPRVSAREVPHRGR